MPPRKSPTVRQKRLGAELRKLREAEGLTFEAAAAVLECGKAKISRIETGVNGIRPVDLRVLLKAYGVQDEALTEALLGMAREGRTKGWWNRYGDVLSDGFTDLAEMESKAVALHSWETTLVPGLLQTADYMRVLFRRGRLDVADEELEHHVAGRMHRQLALDRDNAPQLWAVIYEPVLQAKFGGPSVMRDQLLHLARMAQRDHITIQVLPYTTESHRGVNGSFTIVNTPPPGMDVVRADTIATSLYIEEDAQVRAYRQVFDQLRAAALGPTPSLELIRSSAERL
ncbi:helix-turn-helix domain-containing protein [Actinacidiphila oryziradicis]|uniref:Helix-turn-helix domain-containing protein n=1 Tax=Actinacidiphila oryziradicis TaxID=2571141 RepID=A0A4U0S4J9_9ACTN|nr:helix-turn-helix transcriptional regulator [Actinacidiphila oryziradicis]TKA03007.1 helix-turn-helix domain-containing protein [Actinacidiphila oryziradicis]